MNPIANTKIIKIKSFEKFDFDDTLVREVRLNIFLNEKKVISLMSTPTDEKALAVGYLISENLINSLNEILDIKIDKDSEFEVNIKFKILNPNDTSIKNLQKNSSIISGCGSAKTANSFLDIKGEAIKNSSTFSSSLILSRMSTFYTECDLYEKTGCVHTAKLFINDSEFYIGEDIAQHNTIDKAVGKAILNKANLENSFLMVSGRLSSEMVAKAIMHKIPLLVSRTAATYLGVVLARKFDLTLCGFARGNSMNVYSFEKRII